MFNTVYDVSGCSTPDPDPQDLVAAMRETASLLGCDVRGILPAAFQPHGATSTLVLAESHLTVSTWPQANMAYIDLFTCRADIPPDDAIQPILNLLGSNTFNRQTIRRTPPPSSASTIVVPAAALAG